MQVIYGLDPLLLGEFLERERFPEGSGFRAFHRPYLLYVILMAWAASSIACAGIS